MTTRQAAVFIAIAFLLIGCTKEPDKPAASDGTGKAVTVLPDYNSISEQERRVAASRTPATKSNQDIGGYGGTLKDNSRPGPSSEPSDAKVSQSQNSSDHVYMNNYFGFRLLIPGHWHVFAGEDLRETMKEFFSISENSDVAAFFDLYILVVSKSKHWGRPGSDNSNLGVMAFDFSEACIGIGKEECNKGLSEQLMSGLMHLAREREGNVISGPRQVRLGGKEFFQLDTVDPGEVTTLRSSIATIMKGYQLTFELAAYSKEDLKELETIVYSIYFP